MCPNPENIPVQLSCSIVVLIHLAIKYVKQNKTIFNLTLKWHINSMYLVNHQQADHYYRLRHSPVIGNHLPAVRSDSS